MDSEKIEVARLRSDSNVKIKKIQSEKKELDEKMRKDLVNYQKIVDALEAELLALEANKLRQANDLQLTNSYRNYYEESREEDDSSPEKSPQEEEEQPRIVAPEKMIESSSSDE